MNFPIPKQDRSAFVGELQRYVDKSRRDGSLLGVMLIHLHRVVELNTSFGYKVGDRLLAIVRDRIGKILRPNDSIERIGDHDFVLVLPSPKNVGHASLAANRIVNVLEEPLEIDGNAIKASVAIGIALFPEHAQEADALLRLADVALAGAIQSNSPIKICAEVPDKGTLSSFIIESELRHALMNDEFILYYQPKIDLATRQVCGAEALSRWNNPARGLVPPDVFIPVAEQTNLMLPFTLWSLNLAARQFGEFNRLSKNFSVAVNLSATVLYDPDVVDLINRTIKIWSIRPEQLVLEVTESAMMVDPKTSLETLNRFHDLGVMLSIDDFGTGYSSLAYVKKMPVNELKIDKSFVMNMDKDKGDAMIVRTVIDMAHNFEIAVTAEGVESQLILEQLAELGCDCAQGFYLAKPMPAANLIDWLQVSPWARQTGMRSVTG
ncbi:MAG: bifunctional diguanylate cyclase/phosphodiesterase [Sulfuricaulis sp.]|uniref:putative bifunctional diguanylate cyclase/phosphodiesterase n=1 Tax=Sulfuricaulis sp. TaxID=2003553 RepID=UPI0025FEA703|nr:bifunctional diguanylate cyclase/phosphodiesterase [Sulfuricaulis sp.]MCR4347166.1 bifunctional diguanylate cyclase/phosphodiesterase [Sulfuricaulis sp.]